MSAPDKEKDKEKEETNQKSEDLGLLEEDDEFEEFPAEGDDYQRVCAAEFPTYLCLTF